MSHTLTADLADKATLDDFMNRLSAQLFNFETMNVEGVRYHNLLGVLFGALGDLLRAAVVVGPTPPSHDQGAWSRMFFFSCFVCCGLG